MELIARYRIYLSKSYKAFVHQTFGKFLEIDDHFLFGDDIAIVLE